MQQLVCIMVAMMPLLQLVRTVFKCLCCLCWHCQWKMNEDEIRVQQFLVLLISHAYVPYYLPGFPLVVQSQFVN